MIKASFPAANHPLHNGRLLLTPEDPMATASIQRLEAELRREGLIGSTAGNSAMCFEPGARVFEYLGFTGCAVQLDQGPGTTGLEITLEGSFDAPQQRLGRNSRPPRCAQCRQPLPGWREQVEQINSGRRSELRCTHCHTEAPSWCWSWGRHGGFGRVFISLEPVFPGEGRPLPACFRLLEQMQLGAWRYFFVQD